MSSISAAGNPLSGGTAAFPAKRPAGEASASPSPDQKNASTRIDGRPDLSQTQRTQAVKDDKNTVSGTRTTTQEEERKQLESAVKKLQGFVQTATQNLSFAVDDDSGRMVVKITDSKTNEVVRQIPSKEALEIAQAMEKLQGLLIHQKA